jgi:hypothetical protein
MDALSLVLDGVTLETQFEVQPSGCQGKHAPAWAPTSGLASWEAGCVVSGKRYVSEQKMKNRLTRGGRSVR